MKNVFRKMLSQILFVIVLFWLSPAYADPIVSIQPSSSNVTLGDTFSLDVSISDVADLYAYQFDISFDPTILSASSIAEGGLLPSGGSTFFIPGTIDNPAGTISFTADTLLGPDPGVTGTGILASIDFSTKASGTSLVSLSNVFLLDSALTDISFSTVDATVNVQPSTPVPEPASILLFGTGLVGLIGVKRKLKK